MLTENLLLDPEPVLVVLAGLQFLQVPGMIVGQRYLGWSEELLRLSRVNRCLVVAMGIGIVAYVVGTGAITLLCPEAMARSRLGHALCILQALAWSVRALLQLLVIRPKWPSHVRWLQRSLALIYSTLALGYLAVCLLFARAALL